MAYSRNKEHELIMISIYDALIFIQMKDEFSLEDLMSGVYELPYEDIPLFSKEIVVKSLSHLDEIKAAFQAKMETWLFSRLNNLEQAILIMSYTHVHFTDDNADKGVVIDVAIRLAKKYLDKGDYKFVNAILDNVLWTKTSFQ